MPIIQTAKELGLAIRSRRKELGWDQATLAKQVGVTRQWVIDIEKGKPRAELALAMRALRVLGLSLSVEVKPEDVAPRRDPGRQRGAIPPGLDINAIVEKNRGLSASQLAVFPKLSRPKTAADYLREIEAARRLESLGSLNAAKNAASLLAGDSSLNRLRELGALKLPKTAADYLRETEAASRLESLGSLNAAKSAASLLAEDSSLNRLRVLSAPKLPKTAADYLGESEVARTLDSLADSPGGFAAGAGLPYESIGQTVPAKKPTDKKSVKEKTTLKESRPRKR